MEEFIDRIIRHIEGSLKLPEVTVAHHFSAKLGAEDIHEIADQGEGEEASISAVDGGMSAIIKTPSTAHVLNRVYCNKFIRMDKLNFTETATFASNIKLDVSGRPSYHVRAEGWQGRCPLEDLECMRVDAGEDDLTLERNEIDTVIGMVLRFCEWGLAKRALGFGVDFLLMDGSLWGMSPYERSISKEVFEEARRAGTVVAGISKGSTLVTREGFPLGSFFERLARKRGYGRWVAKVGVSERWTPRCTVYFVKLHESGDRPFRLDVMEGCEGDLERLLAALVGGSKYFAFPGYPYALIDAHKYARVRRGEAEQIKYLVLNRLGPEEAERLTLHERALTPHDTLDGMEV